MKSFLTLIFALSFSTGFAQEVKVMEQRGNELIRALNTGDKEQYRKYIQENYTQALIEKPLRLSRQASGADAPSGSDAKAGNLEAKVAMYQQIHEDIGKATIRSLEHQGEKLDVNVRGDSGANLRFTLTFAKEKPYLIDRLGVELQMGK